jgi:hypothetical protein
VEKTEIMLLSYVSTKWRLTFYEAVVCQFIPSEKLFLEHRKLTLPFHSAACVNTSLKDQEKYSAQILLMASLQTTSGFFMS